MSSSSSALSIIDQLINPEGQQRERSSRGWSNPLESSLANTLSIQQETINRTSIDLSGSNKDGHKTSETLLPESSMASPLLDGSANVKISNDKSAGQQPLGPHSEDTSDKSQPSKGTISGSLIRDWNRLVLDLAAISKRGPTISSRLMAYVNTSLYDSWSLFDSKANGFLYNSKKDSPDKLGGRSTPGAQNSLAFRQAVMSYAADGVFRTIGSSLKALPNELATRADALLQASGVGLDGQSLLAAKALGAKVASVINDRARQDGANQLNNYADTTGYAPKPSVFDPTSPNPIIDSNWQPLPGQAALTPQWGQVQTFASSKLVVPGSIVTPYTADGQLNPEFVDETNQVLRMSMNLTPVQKAIAEYWEAGPGTSYPPGMWIEFTNNLISSRNLDLDQAVKLSFSVSQALMDAGIEAWATKYEFDSVRPITAIRELYYGKTITPWGEPLTDWREISISGDKWQPYQNPKALTPPFPDVVSGHSSFSSAASAVLRSFFGSNQFNQSISLANTDSRYSPGGFDGTGTSGPAVTLGWNFFSEAAAQAGLSRLYGGIHFNDGNWQGQILGNKVGAAVSAKADALFNGKCEISAEDLVSQQFGTMKNDLITGQNSQDEGKVCEIYGFGGDDTLIAGGKGTYHLFGGDGLDRFRLAREGTPTWIRDLEVGETIEINHSGRGEESYSDLIVLQQSKELGSSFTDLLYDGKIIAHMDGQWNTAQLNIIHTSLT